MRVKFLLQETMEAFDGAWTHDWQVSTYYKSDALPTAPHRPLIYLHFSTHVKYDVCLNATWKLWQSSMVI